MTLGSVGPRLLALLITLLAGACTGDDDAAPADAGADASVAGALPFGSRCTDSAQCDAFACVAVGQGRSVCSGTCNGDEGCPQAPNWACLRSPDPDLPVSLCACNSNADEEICDDGIDNDCDGVLDCATDGGPPPVGVPGVDGGPGPGPAPDAGCTGAGCDGEPVEPSCATDPGLCPACWADADCDDGIACTEDRCRARGCLHLPSDPLCAGGEVCDLREDGCAPARACTGDADCADVDACTRAERCDVGAAVCRFTLLDGDGDGHVPAPCGGDDCDDADPHTYPGALDLCDGVDNDCNGSVDPVSAALLCAEGRVCSGGGCACEAPFLDCRGHCIDPGQLQKDERNCGACNTVCGLGTTCEAGVCTDVDECDDDPCGAHASCTNTVGAYSCSCDGGYVNNGDGCENVDECEFDTDGCDSEPEACIDESGGYACSCPDGFSGDGVGEDGCADVDECAQGDDDCDGPTLLCANEVGGFGCTRRVTTLSVGSWSGCAIRDDDALLCWGSLAGFDDGGLTDVGDEPGEMGDALVELGLGTGRSVLALASGGPTCALLDDHSVKCWGGNGYGQLGRGNVAPWGDSPDDLGDNLPVVSLGTGRTAQALGVGLYHVCAVLDDDTLKCWGYNGFGQLGLGNLVSRGDTAGEMGDNLPIVQLGTGRTAKAVSTGLYFTCALLDDDSVKCWGRNPYGQVPDGTTNDRGDGASEMGDYLPVVQLGTGRTAKAISAGGQHACALLDDDTIKCWGSGASGALGIESGASRGDNGGEMGDSLPPVNLGTGRTAKSVSAGDSHTCALLDDDTVKCWGRNAEGQLGLGDDVARGANAGTMGDALPRVDLGTDRTAVQLECEDHNCCALLDDGSVKCWGQNLRGALGLGHMEPRGDDDDEMGDALPALNFGED